MSTIPQLYVYYKRKLNAASTKFSAIMQKDDEKFGWKDAYVPDVLFHK